jgi:hypothetical protein
VIEQERKTFQARKDQPGGEFLLAIIEPHLGQNPSPTEFVHDPRKSKRGTLHWMQLQKEEKP